MLNNQELSVWALVIMGRCPVSISDVCPVLKTGSGEVPGSI